MKFVSVKSTGKKLKDFKHREWQKIHKEHFGTIQDTALWKKKKFIYKAVEGKEILGVIEGDFVAGVMYIEQLLIKGNEREKSIGRQLMELAEALAKENKVHLIYLATGIDWKAVAFYQKLGYKTEGLLKNFYEHKDFRIMTKEV